MSRTRACRELLLVGVLLPLVVGVTYVGCYGFAISHVLSDELPAATTDRVLRFYQPLCRVMPNSMMVRYTESCGLSSTEAFFFVQAMASDETLTTPSQGEVSFCEEFP